MQFVALAAALLPSLGYYTGAEVLATMLEDSASDETLLLPESDLRALIASLDPRWECLGFSDKVAGWQMLLDTVSVSVLGKSAHEYRTLFHTEVPARYFVAKLVEAFRQLSGTGDVSSISIRETTSTQAICDPFSDLFIT